MSLGHLLLTADYAATRDQQEAQRIASELTPAQLKEHFRRLREEMYERNPERKP